MIKQLIYMIIITVVVLFTLPYCYMGVHALLGVYQWLLVLLGRIFAEGSIANFIKTLLAFLAIPLGIAGILYVGYWSVKRSQLPYFTFIVWVIWLVLAVSVVMQQG